jgi:hypothetical protein
MGALVAALNGVRSATTDESNSRSRSENVRRWWARAAFANVRPKIAVDPGDQRRYSCADVLLPMSTDLSDA